MPSFAFTDAKVTVNAVDLSSYVRQATLNVQADQLDDTAMGDSFRSRIGGLKDWSVSLEFNSDFAAGAVDATLFPLLGSVVTVTVKATSATTSATNPQYSGPVLVSAYNPIGNSVGDLATNSVTWQGAGALARATS
ncbi:radical SAM protein [Micromonospora sp. WMMD998]|uniref:radical SAM protein n=1 Tax=Micromonospora sp. WMMD998 TaxID=3016092 RepID=UPI00249A1604|nr:radical SAM protein [Micromonospora sp. WMMD998]WFE41955.1 radical SAM protein [Micromonospora sp. WMMD998]